MKVYKSVKNFNYSGKQANSSVFFVLVFFTTLASPEKETLLVNTSIQSYRSVISTCRIYQKVQIVLICFDVATHFSPIKLGSIVSSMYQSQSFYVDMKNSLKYLLFWLAVET